MSQNSDQPTEEGERGGVCMMVMFATEKLQVQRRIVRRAEYLLPAPTYDP